MSVLPRSKVELVNFVVNHLPAWSGNLAALGLTSTDAAAIEAALAEAQTTASTMLMKRDEAEFATLADNNASGLLRDLTAGVVAKIKVKAEQTNDPNIYVLAMIPPPAPPSPAPPPAKPAQLRVGLENNGAATLTWKATNPPGGSVVYQILRRLPSAPEGLFTLIGTAGGRDKKFTDNTLPSGSSGVQYVVTGQRGSVSGEQSDVLTVTFGVAGGGGGLGGVAFTLTKHAEPVKMAA